MFTKQNTQENMTLLKAVSYYYAKAKNIKTFVVTISIVIPLIFIIYKYFKNIENCNCSFDNYIISVALIWPLIAFFLENRAEKYISIGAKIQEKFDLSLFNIPQNDGLIFSDVSPEIIHKGAEKFKGNEEDLKNWYGGLKKSSHYLKVLLAQRTNVIWGNELKEKFKVLVLILMILTVLSPIFLSFLLNLSFQDSIVFIFIPFSPLLYITIKSYSKLKSQISNNKVIDKKILLDCENFDSKAIDRCRIYQDYIFTENRVKSILIPDWFYKIFRNRMNNMLLETNNKLLDKYKEI